MAKQLARPQWRGPAHYYVAPEIAEGLKLARRHIRWSRALKLLAVTFPLGLLAAGAWIALARFTLLELAHWPSLLFILASLLPPLLIALRRPVTAAVAARLLDRRLGLDERVSTLVELASHARRATGANKRSPVAAHLAADLSSAIHEVAPRLKRRLAVGIRPVSLVPVLVGLLALALAILAPSPLDAVRAERAAVRKVVADELNKVAALRAELESQAGLPRAVRMRLLNELARLQQQLETPGLERAGVLAALADAQERLIDLLPASGTEFDGIVASALTVQRGIDRNTEWDIETSEETNNLAKAAEATEFLIEELPDLTRPQDNDISVQFGQAAMLAKSQDAVLGQALSEASNALAINDRENVPQKLLDVIGRYRDAAQRQQTVQAVEKSLTALEDGRQRIARVGSPSGKRAQVGFRRQSPAKPGSALTPSPGQNSAAGATALAGGGGDASQGTEEDSGAPSGIGPRIGQNVPALGRQSQQGSQGAPAQSSQSGDSTGASGAGGAKTQGQGDKAGTGSESSSGRDASGGDTRSGAAGPNSSFGGTITGPGSGSSPGIVRVENPQGRGVSSGRSQPPADEEDETVYVPQPGQEQASQSLSQENTSGRPTSDQREQEGVAGRPSGGGGAPVGPGPAGPGSLQEVRTPYTEIISEYARLATEALEQAYIPFDAKEYVKEYFAALGRRTSDP